MNFHLGRKRKIYVGQGSPYSALDGFFHSNTKNIWNFKASFSGSVPYEDVWTKYNNFSQYTEGIYLSVYKWQMVGFPSNSLLRVVWRSWITMAYQVPVQLKLQWTLNLLICSLSSIYLSCLIFFGFSFFALVWVKTYFSYMSALSYN